MWAHRVFASSSFSSRSPFAAWIFRVRLLGAMFSNGSKWSTALVMVILLNFSKGSPRSTVASASKLLLYAFRVSSAGSSQAPPSRAALRLIKLSSGPESATSEPTGHRTMGACHAEGLFWNVCM